MTMRTLFLTCLLTASALLAETGNLGPFTNSGDVGGPAIKGATQFDSAKGEFRITGGHWHHAELALDQFFMVRPVPGAAQYQAPVAGLYLCGAGCHPGGGVMGVAGRNAARQVLREAA